MKMTESYIGEDIYTYSSSLFTVDGGRIISGGPCVTIGSCFLEFPGDGMLIGLGVTISPGGCSGFDVPAGGFHGLVGLPGTTDSTGRRLGTVNFFWCTFVNVASGGLTLLVPMSLGMETDAALDGGSSVWNRTDTSNSCRVLHAFLTFRFTSM